MSNPKNAKEFLMSKQGVTVVLIAAGLIGGYLVYTKAKQELQTSLNPASAKNLANRSVEALGKQITGNPNFTVTDQLLKTFPFLRSDAEKKFSESMRNTK